MKYDPNGYAGGVLPEERPLVEKFEEEIIPYVLKNGPRIGEAAMQGDVDAEQVILSYSKFINGMPYFREVNFKACVEALRKWEAKSHQ